jgi:hypothetical protein
MKGKFKLTKRKECTVLIWPVKLIIFAIFLLSIFVIFTQASSFLRLNKPVNGEFLVLDGEMPDYAVKEAIEIFNKSNYNTIVTTGGPLPAGYYISGKSTMAELTYATFLKLGFDSLKIVVIPGRLVQKDRTYTSGISLKKWFNDQNINQAKVDIMAVGCHARRSKNLFQMALGDNYKLGVIAIEDKSYDNKKWWKSSKGFRTVLSESIAFLYAKFLFFPENKENI